jgi:hypothetical protein
VIEKKGGAYAFTADGRDLTGKAAELLDKEFNKKTDTDEEVFLPKGPVKVGESWKVDVVELAKELSAEGMAVDPAKSSATARLVRAYAKNDHRFGVIEVKVELTVTKIGGGGMQIPLKGGSKMDIAIVLDGCIDGSEASGESKMTLTGTLSGEVNGVTLKVALQAENTGSSVEVPKK